MKRKFDKIYWYVVGITGIVLIYVFAITFVHIPKENLRFVDTSLGFLLGVMASEARRMGGDEKKSQTNDKQED